MADQDYNRGGTNWWDPSSAARTAPGADSGAAAALQVMGLGLSSQQQQQQQQQPLDQWNHPLLRSDNKSGAEMGGGGGGGFRSMLQEGMAPFRLGSADVQAAEPEFKPIKGFSLDQQFLDSPSSSVYGNSFQTLIGASDQQQAGYGYQHQQQSNYGMSNSENLMGSGGGGGGGWNKIDHQFLKPSSMLDPSNSSSNKPIHSSQFSGGGGSGGGGLFWNMADVPRPPPASFFPVASPLLNQQQQQHQLSIPCFDEKPQHNVMEVRDTGGPGRKASGGSSSDQTTTSAVTTSTGGTATKRSRNEASSALPPFKVRKEKMGDRITALQQLVSPFGKTDTASVLSEAIEYIKFLHEQVNVLSTPYLKSGASLQHQQSSDKSKDPDGSRQDLRSRGLCLVPLSSTFPVTHETTVDLWTPTFGGTFR